MITLDFLITSLIIVLIPGTGVVFTISIALFKSKHESIMAALGCTIGILPHLIISMFSLLALFSLDSIFFNIVKYLGISYLIYLSFLLFSDKGILKIENKNISSNSYEIVLKAIMINLLNPKLSIFFLSFLPQFISLNTNSLILDILVLSLIFMLMTFIVFVMYAIFASSMKNKLFNSKEKLELVQKVFAVIFAVFAFKLAFF
ncbi:LysE family translocator [Arcobacter sp. LA11]|uniref:LysE family translocator n=1 Tax=Arcobacter sp. LA11 TaxID=1898176 RepID=UPI0009324D9E|nr:LysE family translocator [Arcobacter sp. LA11]